MTPAEFKDNGLNELFIFSLEINRFIIVFALEHESELGIDEVNSSCACLCKIPPVAVRLWFTLKFSSVNASQKALCVTTLSFLYKANGFKNNYITLHMIHHLQNNMLHNSSKMYGLLQRNY